MAEWPTGKYPVILADPPWPYERGGSQGGIDGHYGSMTMEDLKALPVESIAAKDSLLLLWATYPKLPESLDLMNAWGFCVAPEMRVLTSDLRWVPAEELRVGDALLGFDEMHRATRTGDKGRRYFAESIVLSTGKEVMESYRVALEDGTVLNCSADHPWLVRSLRRAGEGVASGVSSWMRTRDIAVSRNNPRRIQPLMFPRIAPVITPRNDYRAGFLAAAFDAEGSLIRQKSIRLSFAQNPNIFLRQVETHLGELDFDFKRYEYPETNVRQVSLRSGMDQSLRFLMEMRPPRLLEVWGNTDVSEISLYNRECVGIESIEPIGLQTMVTLTTSTGTYIAEGFGAHNTYRTVAFTWIKASTESGIFYGLGHWTRGNAEICLLGKRGTPKRASKDVEQLIVSPKREHSRKPELVHERIERLADGPYLELFARGLRPGWTVWGSETDKFSFQESLWG